MPSRYQPVQYVSGNIGPTITVEGLTETIAMLDKLPRHIVLFGFAKALNAAANVMMAELEKNTPIRLEYEGGDLVVAGGALKASVMKTDPVLDSNYRGGSIEVGFGRLGYVANFLEYGHHMVGHKPHKRELRGPKTPGGYVKPYPFVRMSFDASKDQAIAVFVSSIADTVTTFAVKAA